MLIWDVTGLLRDGRLPAQHLPPERLAALWSTLANPDASRAHQAVWSLVTGNEQTVAFLKPLLNPTTPADPQRLTRLMKELDSESFAVRKGAVDELEGLGDLAEPALVKTLAGDPSAETRRQIEQLLQKLEAPAPAERLRELRALAVVEHIGTHDAFMLLLKLAEGAPEARFTQAAKAALERLARRSCAMR